MDRPIPKNLPTLAEARAKLKEAKSNLRAAKRGNGLSVHKAYEDVEYWTVKVYMAWERENPEKS